MSHKTEFLEKWWMPCRFFYLVIEHNLSVLLRKPDTSEDSFRGKTLGYWNVVHNHLGNA